MDNVYCDGSEDELMRCRFDGWGISDCGSNEAAGVICSYDKESKLSFSLQEKSLKSKIKDIHKQGIALRLFGGRVYSEGRVEIKLGNTGKRKKKCICVIIISIKLLCFVITYDVKSK